LVQRAGNLSQISLLLRPRAALHPLKPSHRLLDGFMIRDPSSLDGFPNSCGGEWVRSSA